MVVTNLLGFALATNAKAGAQIFPFCARARSRDIVFKWKEGKEKKELYIATGKSHRDADFPKTY